MDILVAATHNKGKLAEMKKILSGFELRSVGDYDGGPMACIYLWLGDVIPAGHFRVTEIEQKEGNSC